MDDTVSPPNQLEKPTTVTVRSDHTVGSVMCFSGVGVCLWTVGPPELHREVI